MSIALPRSEIAPPPRRVPAVRPARLGDVRELVAIEHRSFDGDRLTPRNFQYLLTKANSACLVAEEDGRLFGYALILFSAGTSLARLYSFAVDPTTRRLGIGKLLLQAAEQAAREHDSTYLRLEVRPDNAAAIRLYKDTGYREFGVLHDFYDDHSDALRMEKSLAPQLKPELVRVPYYQQTLDFTCGPSALMMAMAALDPSIRMNRGLELRLWRESTTVFMTSGHGGCGPYGLALAAYGRGFDVEVHVNDAADHFVDSVRSAEKREVIRLVNQDFRREIRETDIRVHARHADLPFLTAAVDSGGIPIVLISSHRLYRERFPHWLVVTGYDDRFIYAHDPLVEADGHKSRLDCINMPILRRDFERMARYGKAQLRATLIVRKRQQPEPL
jgi:ribosomal-protein-alanine acetyltransferase